MKSYLFITAFIGLFIAFSIIWLIRKDHMHVKYAFGWIIVGIISVIVGFSPGIIDQIAHKLGIGYPPILAVIIAFTFLLIKMFVMDIDRSKQERNLLRLTQKVGILEAELHSSKQSKQPAKEQKTND